jgi:hypothetical protein
VRVHPVERLIHNTSRMRQDISIIGPEAEQGTPNEVQIPPALDGGRGKRRPLMLRAGWRVRPGTWAWAARAEEAMSCPWQSLAVAVAVLVGLGMATRLDHLKTTCCVLKVPENARFSASYPTCTSLASFTPSCLAYGSFSGRH